MHTTQSALDRLQRSTEVFLGLLEGVPDAQWRLRPAGAEWSLAETVEHVVLASQGVLARLTQLLESPLPDEAPRFDDGKISARMFAGVPAPPGGGADPTGRFATRAEGAAALAAARDAIAAFANGAPADLRRYGRAHPVFGTFDGVQWVLFAAAHTDNHVPQLRDLRGRLGLANRS